MCIITFRLSRVCIITLSYGCSCDSKYPLLCENTKPSENAGDKTKNSLDCKAHATEIRKLALFWLSAYTLVVAQLSRMLYSAPYCSSLSFTVSNKCTQHFVCFLKELFPLFLNHHKHSLDFCLLVCLFMFGG